MIRLLHTANLHLDRCYVSERLPGTLANRRRQSLRDTLLGIVRRAESWPADALLIAGDLFEQERIARDTVAFLQQTFESIPNVPVFIAPGHSDPIAPDSPYVSYTWPGNVHIFGTRAWESCKCGQSSLTVHGLGGRIPEPAQDAFAAMRVARDGRNHVAVTYDLPADGPPKHVQYVALGARHRIECISVDSACCVQHCGAPEALGFDEPGPHGYLEVELDEDQTRVQAISSSRVTFETHTLNLNTRSTAADLREAFTALPRPGQGSRMARITLEGQVPYTLRSEIPALLEDARTTFEHVAWIDDLVSQEDFDALAREQNSLGAFVSELNDQSRDTRDVRRTAVLIRAREVGVAAYRGFALPIHGAEED